MPPQIFVRVVTLVRRRPSPEFEQFQAFAFGDGAEAPAFGAMRGPERRRAERMLMRAPADPRVIKALGALGSRRAWRRLSAVFDIERARTESGFQVGGAALIAAAAALWRLSPEERYASAVAGRLRYAPTRGERMDAADALAKMPTDEAREALFAALEDRDALVRHFAARALLEIHGVVVDAQALHHIVRRIMPHGAAAGKAVG